MYRIPTVEWENDQDDPNHVIDVDWQHVCQYCNETLTDSDSKIFSRIHPKLPPTMLCNACKIILGEPERTAPQKIEGTVTIEASKNRNDEMINNTYSHGHRKRYKCEFCKRKFRTSTGKNKHEHHHKLKKFKCPFCARSFVAGYSLKNHIKIYHTSEFIPEMENSPITEHKINPTSNNVDEINTERLDSKRCITRHRYEEIENHMDDPQNIQFEMWGFLCSGCNRVYVTKRGLSDHQKNKNHDCTEFYDIYKTLEKHIYLINQINYIEISPNVEHKHTIETPLEDLIQVSSRKIERSVVLKKTRLLKLLHLTGGNISIVFRPGYGF